MSIKNLKMLTFKDELYLTFKTSQGIDATVPFNQMVRSIQDKRTRITLQTWERENKPEEIKNAYD